MNHGNHASPIVSKIPYTTFGAFNNLKTEFDSDLSKDEEDSHNCSYNDAVDRPHHESIEFTETVNMAAGPVKLSE